MAKNPRSSATALLTLRLARGDEGAFQEFHDQYFNRLYRFLLVVCRGQEHDAQDALQETLDRVVRHVRLFEDEEGFWSWLKTVARNAARDRNRKQRRYLALLQKFAIRLETDIPPQCADGNAAIRDLLDEGLEELGLSDRRLIEGKYLYGETIRELAAEAHVSEKAVESRLLRLRRGLRERLLQKLRNL